MTDLATRLLRLEGSKVCPVRFCWVGYEPADLKPGERLVTVSWEDEDKGNDER